MTEQEKQNQRCKDWYAKNKERKLANDKRNYEAKREDRLAKKREYYKKNKERIKAKVKARRLANLEEERRKDREMYHNRKVERGYVVYYLPKEHYVGMTNNFEHRLNMHKRDKDVTDARILQAFETAVEAHLYETQWHYMGANGFHYKH